MLRVAICDDSPTVLEIIYDMTNTVISPITPVQITKFTKSDSLLHLIETGVTFHIYLLDILMPFVSGIDIAKEIRKHNQISQIIFVTSSLDFALQSYSVNAIDYLLKPIQHKLLESALKKSLLHIKPKSTHNIIIKHNGIIRKIDIHTIEFVEVHLDKLHYYLVNGEELSDYGKLCEIENLLLSYQQFIKTHRSIIVNMDYITMFDSKEVHMHSHSHKLPISRRVLPSLKNSYIKYMTSMSDVTTLI